MSQLKELLESKKPFEKLGHRVLAWKRSPYIPLKKGDLVLSSLS
jgi:hypothetical protein